MVMAPTTEGGLNLFLADMWRRMPTLAEHTRQGMEILLFCMCVCIYLHDDAITWLPSPLYIICYVVPTLLLWCPCCSLSRLDAVRIEDHTSLSCLGMRCFQSDATSVV